jgi:hypothetical protein
MKLNNRLRSLALLLVTASVTAIPVIAAADEWDSRGGDTFAVAVYGDAPYGCKAPATGASDECPPNQTTYKPDSPNGPNPGDPRQLDATPAFIEAVNRDRAVDFVMHAGDIHSGSGYCTLAYDQRIFDLWAQFRDPLIYTPGDNEWTDCQKSKEGGGVTNSAGEYVDYAAGHPVANLALIRSIFFAAPGETLGGRRRQVTSQAQAYETPSDAEYVENVRWEKSNVMFVTLNIPGGSNNDDDLWNTGAFGSTRSAPQVQEVAQRTAADLRWLDSAFTLAQAHGDKAVIIMEQADMWDLDGTLPSAGHIAKYEPFIAKIAQLTKAFGKPVLLINGDSHHYRSDNPLQQGAPCVIEQAGSGTAVVACPGDNYDTHPNYPGEWPNFHRLVVHGATFPLEYIRLTVNPRGRYATSATGFGPFRWERVIP